MRLKTVSIILLLFLGLTAVAGGYGLIADPSGQSLGMPMRFLENTPFSNFFIPGLILFIFNGLTSLLIAILIWRKLRIASYLTVAQGIFLILWLSVQILMIKGYDFILHTTYYITGSLIVFCGIKMIGDN